MDEGKRLTERLQPGKGSCLAGQVHLFCFSVFYSFQSVPVEEN